MSAPASQMLNQCRELARTRLSEVIANALSRIDEDLFALADKSQQRNEQRIYLDAMQQVRDHRSDIQQRFESCFADLFEAKTGAQAKTQSKNVESSFSGGIPLTLVSHSKIENGLSIERLAKGVTKGANDDEMRGISARMGHLLKRDALSEADNPLGAEVIFEALRLACNHIHADNPVKYALLAAFQPYLREAINEVYHAVNEALVAQHVLPSLKLPPRPARDPMAHTGRQTAMNQSQRMGLLNAGSVESAGSSRQGGMTGSTGAAGSSGSSAPAGSAAHGASAGRSGWLGGGNGNEQAALGKLLAGIAQGRSAARIEAMQLLANPLRFPAGAGAVRAGAQLLASLSQLQSEDGGSAAPGYLHQIDKSLLAQSAPLDRLTVELVAMVFDFLYATPRLSEAVKSAISRLQIVAVKAALLDRSFFARREHPMRQLLDNMAGCGDDPLINAEADGPFLQGLRALVSELCTGLKDDCAVFDAALVTLERLTTEEHARHDQAAAVPAAQLAADEAVTAARARAQADLDLRMVKGTPAIIRDFLQQRWVELILRADVEQTSGIDSLTTRLSIASDLAWSVEPKAPADVPILAAILPEMVRGLMHGMGLLTVPDAERQEFFGALMQAHAGAIAAAKIAAPDTVVALRPSQEESTRRAPEPVAAPDDSWERQVSALVKGDIVEFSDAAGATPRYRLSWISPKQSLYLFISRVQMRQISKAELAALFRQGVATRPAPEQSLVDQALASLGESTPMPRAA